MSTTKQLITDSPRTLAELLTEAAQLATWLADERRASFIARNNSEEREHRERKEKYRRQLAEMLDNIRSITMDAKPSGPLCDGPGEWQLEESNRIALERAEYETEMMKDPAHEEAAQAYFERMSQRD